MKVYPRVLEISKGQRRCDFCIENSSAVNDTLLFKIRRTEPKVVDFRPKMGEIPAGSSMTVSVELTDPQAYSGRVIVKFVAIKTRKLCPNFDDSWDIGMGRGMAKKVVEVRNTDLFNPKLIKPKHANFHRESPLSPPRAGQGPRRELSQGQPNPVPAIEPLRQRSPSPLQKGSGMDLDSAKEALERAQELYNTVKSMNSSLRDEIARKGSSPRAMDRKLATENAISRSIVDDLASVETTPLSPQMHRMGKDAFALTPSVGDIRPNAGSPSVPSNTAGFILSDIPPISPRPPRPNKADVAGTIFSFGSLELAAGRNPVEPLASSPSGDMRAHRRHSPISKGGIAPGFGLPTGGLDHHIALPEHRTGIGITIPSDKEAEEDYDDDVFGSDTDWGQGDLTYSKSNINESDVEHKSVFTANRLRSVSGSDEERAAIYQKGNSQSSHIIVDHDSAASENCNSEDEENEKASRLREIDKYAKLEKTALGCSEWRGVLVDTRLSTDFSRLLKDVTSPILPHSGKKFDNQKITAIIEQLSAIYQPLSELPIQLDEEKPTTVLEVEVSGNEVTDEVARMALRLRTAEIFYTGDMVTSLKIDGSSQFTSLWVLDELFGDNNTSGRSGDVMWSRSRIKRHILPGQPDGGRYGESKNGAIYTGGMGSAFEDLLRTGVMQLTVTNCRSMHSLPGSLVSNLRSLIHLNLSHNKIREIQGDLGLILPHLKRLNLSHNLLKSLDKLQGLPSLTALDASHNFVPTLHHGPHMLLPLASHLISLNLLDNPICSLPSYAGETVSLLPNLICFDMRYTKLFVARPVAKANASSQLPVESNRSRVISVPRMDHATGSPEGGHNYVVIERPTKGSSPGYSVKHSPSKRKKSINSPSNAGRTYMKKQESSPGPVPFYPHYGQFKAAPGVLVENTSKGYGQPHKKSFPGHDDESIFTIQSIDSSDDGNRQSRRAIRAFKVQANKTHLLKRLDQSATPAAHRKPATIRADPKTRQLRAEHQVSAKASSSSAQTLISNLGSTRLQKKPKQSQRGDDSSNSVDTELRYPRKEGSDDNDSIQSDSDVSELSANWVGKENYTGNKGEEKCVSAERPASRSEVAAFGSESEISSIRRSADESHYVTGNKGDLFKNDIGRQRENTDLSQDRQQASLQQHPPYYRQHQYPQQVLQDYGQSVNRPRAGSPHSVRSLSGPKFVRKEDLADLLRRHREQTPPPREHHPPILGTEAMAQWQRSVETAAFDSHRKLARSTSGVSFGPHQSSRPAVSRYVTPPRSHSADRSASSIRRLRSGSLSSFGDLRGISVSASLNIPSSSQPNPRNINQVRASVDNSILYQSQSNVTQRQDLGNHTDLGGHTYHPDISLEELAGGLLLGSEFEEQQVRAHTDFGVPRDDLQAPKLSQPFHISDIENYAFKPRERSEPRRRFRQADKMVVPLATREKSLDQPKFETKDHKPSKPPPPDTSGGVCVEVPAEAPQLTTPDHSMGQLHSIIYKSPTKSNSSNPEIASLLSLLRSSSSSSSRTAIDTAPITAYPKQKAKEVHIDTTPQLVSDRVQEEDDVPLPDQEMNFSGETRGAEAGDYMLWLEKQVGSAVEEVVIATHGHLESESSSKSDREWDKGSTNSDVIMLDDPATYSNASVSTDHERLRAAVNLLQVDAGPLSAPSTPMNGSPTSKYSATTLSEDSKGNYPPTPSPMPAYRHPRHMAMKAQQHTPIVEWNPLTRILQPEDPSEDLYPRYQR